MEETGDVRFGRSAFGGFNRRDVMDYIDRLQRAAAAKDGDPAALAQLARERDALERENRRLREEILQLRAHLKVEQTTNELLDEKLHGTDAEAQAHADADESFSATSETVCEPESKRLSMAVVDEMVQKYFG